MPRNLYAQFLFIALHAQPLDGESGLLNPPCLFMYCLASIFLSLLTP